MHTLKPLSYTSILPYLGASQWLSKKEICAKNVHVHVYEFGVVGAI